jgi:hypothetical protein
MSKNSDKDKEMQRLPLIPKELHTEFKLHCTRDGKTMQSAAIEAIQDYINKMKQRSDK